MQNYLHISNCLPYHSGVHLGTQKCVVRLPRDCVCMYVLCVCALLAGKKEVLMLSGQSGNDVQTSKKICNSPET